MTTPAPSYLSDPIALEEWARVCNKHYSNGDVPDEILGPLAIYCGLHGALAGAIATNDIGTLVKLAPLVGQYRTLAAALFGRGSGRQQPGKNPFAQLKDNRKLRASVRARRTVNPPQTYGRRRFVVVHNPEYYSVANGWDPKVARELAGSFVKLGGGSTRDLQEANVIGWRSVNKWVQVARVGMPEPKVYLVIPVDIHFWDKRLAADVLGHQYEPPKAATRTTPRRTPARIRARKSKGQSRS